MNRADFDMHLYYTLRLMAAGSRLELAGGCYSLTNAQQRHPVDRAVGLALERLSAVRAYDAGDYIIYSLTEAGWDMALKPEAQP